MLTGDRESFDEIYLDLSKQSGKCRVAETGVGWKPPGGNTFTLTKDDLLGAQWSRASRGYELKLQTRKPEAPVVQLDGFKQDVRDRTAQNGERAWLTIGAGLRHPDQVLQDLVRERGGSEGTCVTGLELGQGRDGQE